MNDVAHLSDEDLQRSTTAVLAAQAGLIEIDPTEIQARIRAGRQASHRPPSAQRVAAVAVVAVILVGAGFLATGGGRAPTSPPPVSPPAPSSSVAEPPSPSPSAVPVPSWTNLTWTATASAPFGGPGYQRVLGATSWSGGDILVGSEEGVAKGQEEDGLIWQSTNGTDWERVPDTDGMFKQARIASIAAHGSTLVAVGERLPNPGELPGPPFSIAWVSTDGVHWSRDVGSDQTLGQAVLYGVVAIPTGFLAYGADHVASPAGTAQMYTSADGITWQRLAQEDPTFNGAFIRSITATPTGFAAVGGGTAPCNGCGPGSGNYGAAAWWSTDGLTWHASDVGTGAYSIYAVQSWPGSLRALGSKFCCLGSLDFSGPIEWVSTDDGRTWRQTPGSGTATPFPFGGPGFIDGPELGGSLAIDGTVVELEQQPKSQARWSADGQTWRTLVQDGVSLAPQSTQLWIGGDATLIAVGAELVPAAGGGKQVDAKLFVGTLH